MGHPNEPRCGVVLTLNLYNTDLAAHRCLPVPVARLDDIADPTL